MSAPGRGGRWLAIAASVVVAAVVVAAIAVMGSPVEQRAARLDERRVDDLVRIADAIEAHATQHRALPRDLRALAGASRMRLADPERGEPYAYAVTGAQTYRLCAVFATDSGADGGVQRHGDAWSHGRGRQCFDRNTRGKD
jgi:hypothetical protein